VLIKCSRAWSSGLSKKLFIAFGKRREITVYQWKGGVASNLQNKRLKDVLKKYKTYPIPDKPRLLILAGKTMFVGFKEQYDLIHLETSEKRKIFGTGRRSKDAIGVRLINKEVLLVQDKKGYFVDYQAEPTRSKCIEWTDIPLSIAYFHPYIVSVLPRHIEMHHLATSSLVHRIDFKAGKHAASLSYKTSSIWTSFLCVATSNDISAVSQCLISEQLKYLKEQAHFEEALATITLYEPTQFEQEGLDKGLKTKYINEFFAYDLFNRSEWKHAVDKFLESGLSCRRVISLFPTMVPAGQCTRARTKHPVVFQNVKELDSTFKCAVSQFLIPYLTAIRAQIRAVLEEHRHEEAPAASAMMVRNSGFDRFTAKRNNAESTKIILSQLDPPEEVDLSTEWPLSELIDSVFCKCLVESENDYKLAAFLKSSNDCNVAECEILLKQSSKFEELVLLYESHGRHKAALDLMRVKNRAICGINKTIKYLQRLGEDAENEKLILHFSEWVFKEDPTEALRIFTGKSFESQQLQRNQSISPNSMHGLRGMEAPSRSLSGSTSSISPSADGGGLDGHDGADGVGAESLHLPKIEPIRVVDHLDRIKCPIPTRIRYLEILIFEGGETSSMFHDDLIKLYLEEIFIAMDEQEAEDKLSRDKYGLARGDVVELTQAFSLGKYGWVQAGTEARVSKVTPTPNHSIQVYVTFPETGTLGVVPKAQLKLIDRKRRVPPEKQEGRVGDLRRKLIRFLKTSKHFIATNIKNLFPRSALLEEQAWLRSQIPQHREALHIVVYELEDPQMAEEYCRQIYGEFCDRLESVKKELRESARPTSTRSPGTSSSSLSLDSRTSSPSIIDPYNDQYHVMNGGTDRNKIAQLARDKVLNDSKWIEAEKIYLTLLDVYMSPPAEHQRNAARFMRQALVMLRDNHERMDPIAVFNKFPPKTKVRDTLEYMEAVFKSCFERKRKFQVKKNLLKQAHLRLQLRMNVREQNYQCITEETKCSKCSKRIGDAAFVRYPSRQVYHYVCMRSHSMHQYGRGAGMSGQNGSILHHLHGGMDGSNTFDID